MVRNEKSMKKSGTGIAIFAVVVALVGAGALPLAAHASTLTGPPNNLGLQAYYPFDEGVGTKALDHSGNGNTATLVGSPAWVTGRHGKALQFNGLNYASTAVTWPSSGTLAFWVDPTSYNNWISPAGWKYAPSSGGYILVDEGGGGEPEHGGQSLIQTQQWVKWILLGRRLFRTNGRM